MKPSPADHPKTELPAAGAGDVLYVVDASDWIHRCYHAIPPEKSPTGEPCQVTKGFVNMLIRLLFERDPAMLAFAVDQPKPTFRHELYPAYKAGRSELPEEVQHQVARIMQILGAHRIPVLGAKGFEADDALATLTKWALAIGARVVIVARDKDITQVCEERVVVWDGNASVTGPAEVEKRWGVGPGLLGDLLALVGDTTDNIPGVPGVGEAIAADFLRRRGSLDEVLAKPWFAKTTRIRDLLVQHVHSARISRELVGLRTDVPIELDPLELRVGGYDVERLRAIYTELGFAKFAAEVCGVEKAWRRDAPPALVALGDTR